LVFVHRHFLSFYFIEAIAKRLFRFTEHSKCGLAENSIEATKQLHVTLGALSQRFFFTKIKIKKEYKYCGNARVSGKYVT
jgi:hypothetical protein